MVDDDPVADGDVGDAGADRHDPAGRLVAGDHVLVGLRAGAEVLAIDGAQVAAADRGGSRGDQHLAVSGLGVRHLAHVDDSLPGQPHAAHADLEDRR